MSSRLGSFGRRGQRGIRQFLWPSQSQGPTTPWIALGTATLALFIPPIFIRLIAQDASVVERLVAGILLLPAGALNAIIVGWLTAKLLALPTRTEDYVFIGVGSGLFAVLMLLYLFFVSLPEPQDEKLMPPLAEAPFQQPMAPKKTETSPKEVNNMLRAVFAMMLGGANLGAILSALCVVAVRGTKLTTSGTVQRGPSPDFPPPEIVPRSETFHHEATIGHSPSHHSGAADQPRAKTLTGAVFTGQETTTELEATPPPFPDQDREQEAQRMLREAVLTYNSGRRAEGVELLQAVVQMFPGTKAARTAQGYLTKLGRG